MSNVSATGRVMNFHIVTFHGSSVSSHSFGNYQSLKATAFIIYLFSLGGEGG